MTLLVCEPRCELVSRTVFRRKGFHDGARRADDLAVAVVDPLEAVDAAETEPWLELDCRCVSGDDCGGIGFVRMGCYRLNDLIDQCMQAFYYI